MSFNYIDIPKEIELDSYETAINMMAEKLMNTGKVKCVYQIGGVSSPGISDIDLYVIFNNDCEYKVNPVNNLNTPDNYLFTHNLFGTSESSAVHLEQYTFFGNYKLIAGSPVAMNNYFASDSDQTILKRQIALEYLIKAWFSIHINITYKNIKLRSLLLHSKAILYDLDFLSVKNGGLFECINDLLEIRKNYFTKNPDLNHLDKLCNKYKDELKKEIVAGIESHKFYIAASGNTEIGKHSLIFKNENPVILSSGLSFPHFLTSKFKKLLKIQNKFHNFKIGLPYIDTNLPPILEQRSETIAKAINYNRQYLPHFISTAYGMNIFKS